MAKVKFDKESGMYKLKVNEEQMHLIAKVFSYIRLGTNNPLEKAAGEIVDAIERGPASHLLYTDAIEITAVREDSQTGRAVYLIANDELIIETRYANTDDSSDGWCNE
jgi:hypothetical protein